MLEYVHKNGKTNHLACWPKRLWKFISLTVTQAPYHTSTPVYSMKSGFCPSPSQTGVSLLPRTYKESKQNRLQTFSSASGSPMPSVQVSSKKIETLDHFYSNHPLSSFMHFHWYQYVNATGIGFVWSVLQCLYKSPPSFSKYWKIDNLNKTFCFNQPHRITFIFCSGSFFTLAMDGSISIVVICCQVLSLHSHLISSTLSTHPTVKYP